MRKRRKSSPSSPPKLPESETMLHSLPLRWCIALLIAGLAWVVYQPALGGRFILDDDLLLTGNATIRAPDGLARIWFSTEPADYWPVTNTSLWLEWRLWGASSNGYHVTNLLLHIVACWLIWWVLAKLSIPGAPLAALLFAVHPINVESVAWIAQRKNVLALLFFLLAIGWYLNAEGDQRSENAANHRQLNLRWYGLSLAAFVLAMLRSCFKTSK
jgi:protein O-mannosyl-transferase